MRDIARIAAARGLAFHMPQSFPANGLKAARLSILGMTEGWGARFSKAVYEAEFANQRDIASGEVLEGILLGLGLEAPGAIERSGQESIKERLRAATGEAEALGIFGAPAFVTADNELFWGDDRLKQALAHARKLGP